MNNAIQRTITLTASYAPLATTETVASVVISAVPGNVADVEFLGDLGEAVRWIPGEWHTFVRVDLSEIKARGTAGDKLTIVGGTW